MITCPWCGTSYEAFQSNCKNCGGPLPPQALVKAEAPEAGLLMPAPPPRSISDSYAWRLLRVDPWALTAGVFVLLGVIWFIVGVPLTIGIITAPVGIPFAGLGLLFAGGGIAVWIWRHGEAQKTLDVLRRGEAAPARITSLEQNYSVRINGRNPWVIRYRFRAGEQDVEGKLSTVAFPGEDFGTGKSVYVLYLPEEPERNALFPHP